MKIIDLLNKIANGDRPNFRFRDNDYIYDEHDGNYRPSFLGMWKIYAILNDEVEILEEKKIPEKLEDYDFDDSLDANTKCECLRERMQEIENQLDEIIDFLKQN